MKNNIHQMGGTVEGKEPYIVPKIEVLPLELEYGIAVGSAIVRPPSNAGSIQTEWEKGVDREVVVEW